MERIFSKVVIVPNVDKQTGTLTGPMFAQIADEVHYCKPREVFFYRIKIKMLSYQFPDKNQ